MLDVASAESSVRQERHFVPTNENIREASEVMRKHANLRLSRTFRDCMDPNDLVQEAWCSYYSGSTRAKDLDEFYKLMVTITNNTTRNKIRFHSAMKRSERKTLHLGEKFETNNLQEDPPPIEEVLECFDAGYHELLELLLAGHTQAEAAEQLHCNERTVRRHIRRIRNSIEDSELLSVSA